MDFRACCCLRVLLFKLLKFSGRKWVRSPRISAGLLLGGLPEPKVLDIAYKDSVNNPPVKHWWNPLSVRCFSLP
jgi:hypothetical protein